MQAYQNLLRDPIVEHKNMSIRKISLKNQNFKHVPGLKGTVKQINRKTPTSSIDLEKKVNKKTKKDVRRKCADGGFEPCPKWRSHPQNPFFLELFSFSFIDYFLGFFV
jgi:hypothetical protein